MATSIVFVKPPTRGLRLKSAPAGVYIDPTAPNNIVYIRTQDNIIVLGNGVPYIMIIPFDANVVEVKSLSVEVTP